LRFACLLWHDFNILKLSWFVLSSLRVFISISCFAGQNAFHGLQLYSLYHVWLLKFRLKTLFGLGMRLIIHICIPNFGILIWNYQFILLLILIYWITVSLAFYYARFTLNYKDCRLCLKIQLLSTTNDLLFIVILLISDQFDYLVLKDAIMLLLILFHLVFVDKD